MDMRIRREMTFVEVMRILPESVEIFKAYNLDCSDCQLAEYASLERGCKVCGVDLERLIEALNNALI